jgi:hypothetical protein
MLERVGFFGSLSHVQRNAFIALAAKIVRSIEKLITNSCFLTAYNGMVIHAYSMHMNRRITMAILRSLFHHVNQDHHPQLNFESTRKKMQCVSIGENPPQNLNQASRQHRNDGHDGFVPGSMERQRWQRTG